MLGRVASVRIVVFGDTHLGFDSRATAHVGRRRRGDDFEANFDRVLLHARNSAADVLVHCGDFFHRSRMHPSVVDRAFERLAAVAAGGTTVLIVPGNHDRSKLPPSLWLGHPNVHVFERPKTVELQAAGLRLAFAGFPFAWGDLRGRFPALMEATGLQESRADATFLCMHHTVSGATVGPSDFVFRSGRDVISRPQLPRVFAVFAGHIHRHQVLQGEHAPVFYAGSTERTSFAEKDEPKGFLDLTIEPTGKSGVTLEWRFNELPARPMVDVDVPASVGAAGLERFLRRASDQIPSDSVVRIKSALPLQTLGLTAATLRSVFPATMNVQWRGEFVRGRQ